MLFSFAMSLFWTSVDRNRKILSSSPIHCFIFYNYYYCTSNTLLQWNICICHTRLEMFNVQFFDSNYFEKYVHTLNEEITTQTRAKEKKNAKENKTVHLLVLLMPSPDWTSNKYMFRFSHLCYLLVFVLCSW